MLNPPFDLKLISYCDENNYKNIALSTESEYGP